MEEVFNLKAKDIINLDKKLSGELPITNVELLALVNSWGRLNDLFIFVQDEEKGLTFYKIPQSKPQECHDLSKLDTSKVIDMSNLFACTEFNNDISNWNVSNVTNMMNMFAYTCFNGDISSWDVSNVINMNHMFYMATNFNKPLDAWNVSKVINMNSMFCKAKSFEDKYNNGKALPIYTNDFKIWFENNRDKMRAIDIEYNNKEDIDSFFLKIEKPTISFNL